MRSSILDTRDLAKRQDELNALQSALDDAREELANLDPSATGEEREAAESAVASAESEFGEDEAKELAELDALEADVSEWTDGNTLIPEHEWVDYVRQLCEDLGDIPRNFPSYIEIDWDATAKNLAADYSVVTWEGEEYYVRS
jgi:uncharacterized protein YPO0396